MDLQVIVIPIIRIENALVVVMIIHIIQFDPVPYHAAAQYQNNKPRQDHTGDELDANPGCSHLQSASNPKNQCLDACQN